MIRYEVTADLRDAYGAIQLGEAAGMRVALAANEGLKTYTPLDTGRLMNTTDVKPWTVTYTVPYAPYVFYMPASRIRKVKNPTATSHWTEKYQSVGAPEVVREIELCLKEYSKGVIR